MENKVKLGILTLFLALIVGNIFVPRKDRIQVRLYGPQMVCRADLSEHPK